MASTSYEPLGIIAISILAVGLAFVTIKWPKGKNFTFSQHIAERKSSIAYYIVLFLIVLPLLMAFFVQWFVPAFHISSWFLMLVGMSSVAQIICTFIPESGGKQSDWHRAFAGVSGLLLLPALSLLMLSSYVNGVEKIIIMLSLCTMLFIIGQVVVYKGKPQNFLVLQSLYFAAFFIPILIIAYVR